ncbi:MAG: carbon monoxide dehydrogenase subunit G [Nocardioides sp.]|uniref:SRPBCC family protein n=1 Tax=Nocardioides sp. TaxID=35761 RepID=UPI0039E60923
MKIAGSATLHAPVERAWAAVLDPAVLVATIPGCERLVAAGENAYDMTVTAGVAAIKGTYAGSCRLHDLDEHHSLILSAQGSGAPGTIATDVAVTFAAAEDGTTTVSYDADAVVGGMIAGVGQRMLASVSRRMAAEFFANVDRVLAEGPGRPSERSSEGSAAGSPSTGSPPAGGPSGVFTAPARPGTIGGGREFLSGVAVGAGLVALGVVLGAVAGRRR